MATNDPSPKPKISYNLHEATLGDFPSLAAIADSAVQRFASIPQLSNLRETVSLTPEVVNTWLRAGKVFIASTSDNGPVGFISTYPLDDLIHISHLSVSLDWQGKGVGGVLINGVLDWAREQQAGKAKTRVSLMTYREVPWHAPWYSGKFGFKLLDAEGVKELGPAHVEKMRADREDRKMERDGYGRCCMLWEEVR